MGKLMLTQKQLKQHLTYNPDTGIFTRIKFRQRATKFGPSAGTIIRQGEGRYVSICIEYKRYSAHRLAWLYIYGAFPSGIIDHINGNGMDNRISNLRSVTYAENSRNATLGKKNKTGVLGVAKTGKKWGVCIGVNGKCIRLGSYSDFDEAVAVRKQAEIEHGYHENHGKKRINYSE